MICLYVYAPTCKVTYGVAVRRRRRRLYSLCPKYAHISVSRQSKTMKFLFSDHLCIAFIDYEKSFSIWNIFNFYVFSFVSVFWWFAFFAFDIGQLVFERGLTSDSEAVLKSKILHLKSHRIFNIYCLSNWRRRKNPHTFI